MQCSVGYNNSTQTRILKISIFFFLFFRMKWWCLVLAIGLLQVAVFLETTEAKRGRDTDGDGTPDQG